MKTNLFELVLNEPIYALWHKVNYLHRSQHGSLYFGQRVASLSNSCCYISHAQNCWESSKCDLNLCFAWIHCYQIGQLITNQAWGCTTFYFFYFRLTWWWTIRKTDISMIASHFSCCLVPRSFVAIWMALFNLVMWNLLCRTFQQPS